MNMSTLQTMTTMVTILTCIISPHLQELSHHAVRPSPLDTTLGSLPPCHFHGPSHYRSMPLKVFHHLCAPSSIQHILPLFGSLFIRVPQLMALCITILLQFSHRRSTSWRCSPHLRNFGTICIIITPFYHRTQLHHLLLPNPTPSKQSTSFLPSM